MNIKFKLIRISWFKTLLRPLNLLLVFLPAYTHDKIDCLTETNFWGIWGAVWLVIFFIQIGLVKRYKVIGEIRINKDSISFDRGNSMSDMFTPDQKLEIYMEYNGYKGETEKYKCLPLDLPVLNREGTGKIIIIRNNKRYAYRFVSPRNYSVSLKVFAEYYQKNGNKVDIIFD